MAVAGRAFLTDGVVGDGHAEVDVDDYGSFGRLVGPNDTDDFDPVGATPFTPTYMAGAYLFVHVPGDVQATMVMLTGHRFWVDLVEPPVNSGDAYVNAVAGEECELDDPLCDAATCAYAFTLGGGCVGCGAGDASGALPWSMFLALCILRRRRPPSRPPPK